MDLNKAMIIGRLTKDPEVKTTPTGQTVATFSLATNLVWNDQSGQKQEKVEFHNIVAWRRLADIVGKYLKKGAKVYIEGRIQTRDWVGQDNLKRYRTEIIADNMIMLGGTGAPGGGQFGHDNVPMPSGPEENYINIDEPRSSNNNNVEEDEIRVENIPF